MSGASASAISTFETELTTGTKLNYVSYYTSLLTGYSFSIKRKFLAYVIHSLQLTAQASLYQ